MNWDLLNSADYENFDSVKSLLVCYQLYERKMAKGDSVAAAIWVDLDTAIHKKGLLTRKQMEVVDLVCKNHMKQDDVAEYLSVSRRTVRDRFDVVVRKIQKMLISGKLFECNTP